MTTERMTHSQLETALRRLLALVESPVLIEINLIGSAAGLLASELPASRTTLDCDIASAKPDPAGVIAIAEAAAIVADELGLPAKWINDEAIIFGGMPEGWASRRHRFDATDSLVIYFISRIDLIAMKVHANRPQDRQDLADLAPTPDEYTFARRHIEALAQQNYSEEDIHNALEYLDAMEADDEN